MSVPTCCRKDEVEKNNKVDIDVERRPRSWLRIARGGQSEWNSSTNNLIFIIIIIIIIISVMKVSLFAKSVTKIPSP